MYTSCVGYTNQLEYKSRQGPHPREYMSGGCPLVKSDIDTINDSVNELKVEHLVRNLVQNCFTGSFRFTPLRYILTCRILQINEDERFSKLQWVLLLIGAHARKANYTYLNVSRSSTQSWSLKPSSFGCLL